MLSFQLNFPRALPSLEILWQVAVFKRQYYEVSNWFGADAIDLVEVIVRSRPSKGKPGGVPGFPQMAGG